ncbi:MAG TPA: cytochrome P450 [Frankiaceae bacterium]|jgi:cytochrome P450|nr:cytochrome P450 [Frankiaceae bacterium]
MDVDYDPYSEEAMLEPQALYARLRAEDPVHYLPDYDAWALACFDDVWQAGADAESYSVLRGQTPNQVLLGEPSANLTFPELDPPEHPRRRRVLTPAYTREAAQRELPVMRAIAHEVLAPLVASGTFDAFDAYASTVSARYAGLRAGIPAADVDTVRRLLHAAIAREPGQQGTSEANAAAMGEVFGYLHQLVAGCRNDPARASGLLRELLGALVDGVPLDDAQIAAELHTLLVTGSETVELATAAALVELDRHPDQKSAAIADPASAGRVFAEAVRFDHPTDMLCRVVRRETEVRGRRLREGQGVLLLWGSANRDEREFERASCFDIDRRPARALLFGHGQHKCIGEHVAMQMGAALLGEFLSAVKGFSIDRDHLHRRRGEFLKGFDAVPVAVTAR